MGKSNARGRRLPVRRGGIVEILTVPRLEIAARRGPDHDRWGADRHPPIFQPGIAAAWRIQSASREASKGSWSERCK